MSTHAHPQVDAATPPKTASASARPVAVSELQRAWSAVQNGDFRHAHATLQPTPPPQTDQQAVVNSTRTGSPGGSTSAPHPSSLLQRPGSSPGSQRWMPAPGERVLPVVGAAGSVGCSTVALSLATAAAHYSDARWASRVLECCSAPASGLAAASTAELGHHESGWVRGTRGGVLLERASRVLPSAGDIPEPAPISLQAAETDPVHDPCERLTVLDAGWEVGHLLSGDGWLADFLKRAPIVVVVARPTIPGFRRLEAALELLEANHGVPTQIAVLGGRRKRWPRGVERSAGPRIRAALREDRLHEIPTDRHLAAAGLGPAPLPPGLTAAAERLLTAAVTTSLAPPLPSAEDRTTAHVPGGDLGDDGPNAAQPQDSTESSAASTQGRRSTRLDAGTHLETTTACSAGGNPQ